MKCPFCGAEDTQVRDSRPSDDKLSIKRRRYCLECNSRFTTMEHYYVKELIVIKTDGSKELFDKEKIIRSINTAMRKRVISQEKIVNIVNSLMKSFENMPDSEIASSLIGDEILKALANLDQVAYIRFASVYKDFNTTADFEKFIREQNEQ